MPGAKRKKGTVRIIGGRWRRCLLHFPDLPGLRPTHDQVRETLFNWLMPHISGARCLDLFAGSGALGFEALSRGAAAVSFVDSHPQVLAAIKTAAKQFAVDPDQIEIILGRCPEQKISLSFKPYDIVFLDPPFHQYALSDIVAWLAANRYLAKQALIYVEIEKQREQFALSEWIPVKEGHTKKISYFLFQKGEEA